MASKSKRCRKVLGASCILAALIIAGSSFAWFTSKDEVTNRLTASSNYGVALAEDFTPPENWIPGQEINKDVGVVNTGNVDAFARVWLEGEFNLVKEGTGIQANPTSAYAPTEITDNDKMKNLGFEEVDDSGTKSYVKVLSKNKTLNANNHNTITNDTDAYSEVQAMQAGGFLAYAPTGAKYKYTLNQNKAVDVYYDGSNHAVTDIVAGSTVIVGDTIVAPSGTTSTTYVAPANTAGDIDSESFLPMTTGLYLFRRNVDVNNGKTDKDWEYSGYYYVADNNDTGGQGKYYALKTKTDTSGNDTVYVDGIAYNDGGTPAPTSWYVDQQTGAIDNNLALTNVKLFTAVQSVVSDDGITWAYVAAPGNPAKLTATVTATSGDDAQKLSVDVALANIGDTTNKWHHATTGGNADKRDTFYYTNDIEEGDTTQKLVDSVTLNKDTKQTAYIAFDFDLNVKMDSIQVTIASDGKEAFDTVKTGWDVGSTKAVNQKAETTSALEIDTITWANP